VWGRNHERRAKEIADQVLMGTVLEGAKHHLGDERVKRADHLAAGVDRWLLSKLIGQDYNKFPFREVKIKNIFNPKFSESLGKNVVGEDQLENFSSQLNRILRLANDPSLAYHVLCAGYEACWIVNDLPAGPADTRAPSHNVLDHDYATASMMNWVVEGGERGKPQGILLYIDLGGPQRFISSSRKLRDLWVSSYLASALAWRLFWIFIRAFGPDVMVLPSCRGNPFYYHSLISELIKRIGDSGIVEIKKILKEVSGYDPEESGIPRYAVVPVTATFMLPDINTLKMFDDFKDINNPSDLEKFVEEEYRKIWGEIYQEVTDGCKLLEGNLGNFAKEAALILGRCKDYGFGSPPLPIRVMAICTEDLYKLQFIRDEKRLDEEDSYKLYHYMFKLLRFNERRRKLYKFRSEEELSLCQFTKDLISKSLMSYPEVSEKGFDYCTVCGYLPAVVIMPSNEEGFKKRGLDLELEPVFSFGERLCPYCLIKRLLSIGKILKQVMERLLGRASRNELELEFPSVSDIATLPFKESFIEAVRGIDEADDKSRGQFLNLIKELWNEIRGEGGNLHVRNRKSALRREKDLLKSIDKMKSNVVKERLEELLLLESEANILRKPGLRKIWRKFLNKLNNLKYSIGPSLILEKINPINIYYATIRSDADNFGKIITGNVEKGFRINIMEYLGSLLEGDAGEVIRAIMDGRLDYARKICERNGLSDIDAKLSELREFLGKLICRREIIVSPSYHSALSRALVNNSSKDIETIDKYGMVIYAGGDDLLAVIPVVDCLRAVRELRTNFSFPLKEPRGFYGIKSYLMPSLATASRSFSVYLGHYIFPMYVIMGRSAELLDGLAKEAKWIVCGSEKREKDALVLSYSPRGGEQSALLPLNDAKLPDVDLAFDIENLQKLIDLIEGPANAVRFSSSLIYDLYDGLELIRALARHGNEFLLRKALEHVFYRNSVIESRRREEAKIWAENLMRNYDLIFKIKGEERTFLSGFVSGLMLYRSGLREGI